jgi:hypothetical protein
MAFASWQATIVDESGDVVPGATITVLREIAGQPPAQCYSDRNGSTPIGSTFSADADGFVRFFVAGGAYQITATSGSFSRTWRYVAIGTAAETDAGTIVTAMQPSAWGFDDTTSDADPGSGLFRLNNSTPASATAAYIDNENAGAVDVSAWLDTLDDSGDSSNRGLLTIFDPDAPTEVFRAYTVSGSVTDGTGYRKLTITHIAGSGSFSTDGTYTFSFAPRGPTGPQGIQGIQGIQGEQGEQGPQGDPGEVPSARTLTAGNGLTGGGDLSANRTFDVGGSTSIIVGSNDVQRAALTGAVAASQNSNDTTSTVDLVISIGGSSISTGIVKGADVHCDFAFTITAWTLLADQSGAIKIDVWKDTYANYPPTDADSITNGHEPEITASGTKAQDTSLGDWTTVSVSAGDVLRFNVDSVTSITAATLILKCTKTS